MESLRKFFGIFALCSLCMVFTACPGGDDSEPTPIPPVSINNSDDDNSGGGNSSGDNSGGGNSGGEVNIPSNDRGPISYSIDGQFFKTVLVEGGSMGDFYIMQTEFVPGYKHVFRIEEGNGKGEYQLDVNGDNIITKIELFSLLNKLQTNTGLPWRLPTRDEWVFAAKGGKKSSRYTYCGSNSIDDVAWYNNNSSNKVHEVARKKPNELGLYDMSGNYAELVYNDVRPNSEDDTEKRKESNVDGDFYGGCWKDPASECTSSSYKEGSIEGKVREGSKINEMNSFDGDYVTIRLVYSK